MSRIESLIPPEWVATLRAWAERERLIEALYVFGSRATGAARPDSDLDIAVLLCGSENTRLCNWIENGNRWETELRSLLPVEVDLDLGDPDLCEHIVGPAVVQHGVEIYRRVRR